MFEGGYRVIFWNNLFFDVGYYYNIYIDFIGFNIVIDVQFDFLLDFVFSDVQVFRFVLNVWEMVII